MDEKGRTELGTHIKDHVSYPISKEAFMASCGNLGHVPAETKEWVAKTLPDQTFQSADDVYHALNLAHDH